MLINLINIVAAFFHDVDPRAEGARLGAYGTSVLFSVKRCHPLFRRLWLAVYS